MNLKPILWAEQTWETIRDMRADGVDMVIFPIGSTEQHGPHLPLNVDSLSAEIVAHAVSARTAVPVLPTLPFGCALGHTRHWPGTLSLSPETLSKMVCEILDDVIAYGFTRILILSGHVTNAAPLRCALETLRARHPKLQIASKHVCEASAPVKSAYESDALDWHANAAETALMLHLAPHLVRNERIFDDEDRTRDLVFSYAVPKTSLEGHTGSPSLATEEMGAELFEQVVRDWTYIVKKALIEEAPLSDGVDKKSPPKPQPLPETSPDTLFGRPL
jgi:creatinine amidohydrolase